MGNVPAILADFLPPTWGKRGVSTLEAARKHTKPDGTYDWDAAVTTALAVQGKKVELPKGDVDRLHAFLRKDFNPHKQETREAWEARWMEKWEKRWGDLTPADVPWYMGKRGRYPFDIFLDELVFGATNQPWGNSDCPSVLEYAMREDLPAVPMLIKFWD